MMESDLGKLFVGGISWETTEDRLREYFRMFGDVVEAVIMKDRTTGRARGFGFIVFADPTVADRVTLEKHMINGRTVEAKKVVPRDDSHVLNRNTGNLNDSGSPARTKKIFVGGLASTVAEADFRKYFDQFGTITDVVMYDHNTQRPRGFGFITYDSEDAVDRVLFKNFHELNGKMVEVKRAIPKGLSPSPNRPPLGNLGYGLNRIDNLLNGHALGYNPNLVASYQMRMDGRFNPLPLSRSGYSPFTSPRYGLGANLGPSLPPNSNGNSYIGSLNYARGLNSYSNENPSRYNNLIGYRGNTGLAGPFLNISGRDALRNGGLGGSSPLAGFADYGSSGSGTFGNVSATWGFSSSGPTQGEANNAAYADRTLRYGNFDGSYGFGGSANHGRTSGTSISQASYNLINGNQGGSYLDIHATSSMYGDPTWRSIPKSDGSTSFNYAFEISATDTATKDTGNYLGGYDVTSRQSNRGVAA